MRLQCYIHITEWTEKKSKKISSELNQVCDPFLFRRFFSSLFEIGELLTGDFRVALMFFFCSDNFIHNGNELCACIAGELMNIRVKAEQKVQTIRRK